MILAGIIIHPCQAGEKSQINVPEHAVVSIILTDLILRRNHVSRAAFLYPLLNQQSCRISATRFQVKASHVQVTYSLDSIVLPSH